MEPRNHQPTRRSPALLRILFPLLLVGAIAVIAAACGDDDGDGGAGADAAATTPAAEHTDGEELTVTDAWARFPKEDTGAVYFVINGGAVDDALLGAKVDFAMAQVHETVTSGSSSMMQHIEELPVPANDHVTLEPGGYHVMLMNLQQPPEVGSTFELQLEFEHAGTIAVTVEVRPFE